jgi:hypothetical protein
MNIARQIQVAGFFLSLTGAADKVRTIAQIQLQVILADPAFFVDFDDYFKQDVDAILANNINIDSSTLPWVINREDNCKVIVKRYKTNTISEYDAYIASGENGYYTKLILTLNDDEAKCAKQIAAFKECVEKTDFMGVRFSAQ